LGLPYAILRTESPDRPDNTDNILDECVSDAFTEGDTDDPHNKEHEDDNQKKWMVEDDVRTDGGATVGFFDIHTCDREIIPGGSTQ
jgi:hypothetical protein